MNQAKRILSPAKKTNEIVPKKHKISKFNLQVEQSERAVASENYDFLFDGADDFDLNALDNLEKNEVKQPKQLNLSQWTRCRVQHVERDQRTFDLVVQVSAEAQVAFDKENAADSATSMAICRLQGPWSHTHIEIGDIISIMAVWDTALNSYKVDKDHGFCVTNPDTLISGTTVVGSLFCRRKAVLQERFRGIDANNKVMVVGSLVHELLQIVLRDQLHTSEQLDKATKTLLESQEVAYMLYGSLLTREEIIAEVLQFVPNILSFVQQYVQGREPALLQPGAFQGTIAQIEDIEENLWVPQLGLKGKVDVSVRINRRRGGAAPATTVLPLELKTGRATFSMEHKGQVLLYQMMLTALGNETHSGLLLYLREGIMRELRGARNEQRDLIVLRNDLGHYLSSALPTSNEHNADNVQPFALPEPISHHSACGNCAYNTLCCSFAQTDDQLQLRDGHPLRSVMTTTTAHLTPPDFTYFLKWCRLLSLEEQEVRKVNYLRALWTQTSAQRQQQGRALTGLQLQQHVKYEEARYRHTFTGAQSTDFDFTLSGFSVGEYVIVSSEKRLALAAGWVGDTTPNTITVSLERNLHAKYAGELFIVDKHESQAGHVFNYTNLGLLLEDSERAATLRRIIVALQAPNYGKVLPRVIATAGAELLRQLNAGQRAAVLRALTTDSYMLIKGLPGTGKTQTLVVLVRLLQLLGKSVLITSHTHSAVDNLLLRLLPYDLPLLRLGAAARTHAQLHACSETELLKDCKSVAALEERYAAYAVVGVTCLGAAHSIFLHRQFDYCIVDEATQVMQCSVLRPLFHAAKFVLVGDPDQLPPLIRSREARLRGADESLFQRLDAPHASAVLTLQYRMNKTITKLANDLTYAGALECGNDAVKLASIKLPLVAPTVKWLQRALHTHIDQAICMLDTLDCAQLSNDFASAKHQNACVAIERSFGETQTHVKKRLSKNINYCEAAVILHTVRALLTAGCAAADIGVVAPYRAQVELLRQLSAQYQLHYPELNFDALEVNTVDQYQGRDKNIILYSGTRTGAAGEEVTERARESEILEDKRRITVAITRAKHKLILVGDLSCLQQYTPFRTLLAHTPRYCKLSLQNDKLDFSWSQLLDELSQVIAN